MTQAVDPTGRLQLGRTFMAAENVQIVAFLKTLTGEQPKFALPILPPNTDATPLPQPFRGLAGRGDNLPPRELQAAIGRLLLSVGRGRSAGASAATQCPLPLTRR